MIILKLIIISDYQTSYIKIEFKEINHYWERGCKMAEKKIVPIDIVEKIKRMHFEKGISVNQISKEIGLSRDVIKRIFRENGWENQTPKRIYEFNEDYFEEIDSHQKAYWLGFIYADGGVNTSSGVKRLRIELQKGDREQLERFRNHLEGYNTPIKEDTSIREGRYSSEGSYYIEFFSKKMVEDLSKWGVYQNKTLTLTYPKNIDPTFHNSFILGYFDGDGGISVFFETSTQQKRGNMKFVGTYDMLNNIQANIYEAVGLKPTYFAPKKKIFTLEYRGKRKILSIAEWMYSNMNKKDCLSRKVGKFEELRLTRDRRRGATYVLLKCPNCNSIFEKEKHRTHLGTYNSKTKNHIVTCCSSSCTYKFLHKLNVLGITDKIKKAIEENVVKVYLKD